MKMVHLSVNFFRLHEITVIDVRNIMTNTRQLRIINTIRWGQWTLLCKKEKLMCVFVLPLEMDMSNSQKIEWVTWNVRIIQHECYLT